MIPILYNEKHSGKKHVLIKKGNGFTLKTPRFSYTEYLNPKDNTLITSMLYDHKTDAQENINVVNEPDYKEDVIRLKKILHSTYQNNIIGE
mgnify:CR=1 FL=1